MTKLHGIKTQRFLCVGFVSVYVAAALTGPTREARPEGAACFQLPEGSAARWQDSATAPPCEASRKSQSLGK